MEHQEFFATGSRAVSRPPPVTTSRRRAANVGGARRRQAASRTFPPATGDDMVLVLREPEQKPAVGVVNEPHVTRLRRLVDPNARETTP